MAGGLGGISPEAPDAAKRHYCVQVTQGQVLHILQKPVWNVQRLCGSRRMEHEMLGYNSGGASTALASASNLLVERRTPYPA